MPTAILVSLLNAPSLHTYEKGNDIISSTVFQVFCVAGSHVPYKSLLKAV
jgi:hypothetical protein